MTKGEGYLTLEERIDRKSYEGQSNPNSVAYRVPDHVLLSDNGRRKRKDPGLEGGWAKGIPRKTSWLNVVLWIPAYVPFVTVTLGAD